MTKNPGLVFFGIFLVSMLFVPPSIPFMVPEAEATTYTISVTNSDGFSQSALTIALGDSVTFTTTVSPPYSVAITDPHLVGPGGQWQFDSNSPPTFTFNQCGTIVFEDKLTTPAQFAPMTLTVDCPVFTIVHSINSEGYSCLGFENLPVGAMSVSLLYEGNVQSTTHNIQPGSSFFDGVTCHTSTSHQLAGEYQYLAGGVYSTSLILEEYQLVPSDAIPPTVNVPADMSVIIFFPFCFFLLRAFC